MWFLLPLVRIKNENKQEDQMDFFLGARKTSQHDLRHNRCTGPASLCVACNNGSGASQGRSSFGVG
jgi:hypothetical protein